MGQRQRVPCRRWGAARPQHLLGASQLQAWTHVWGRQVQQCIQRACCAAMCVTVTQQEGSLPCLVDTRTCAAAAL